MIARSFEHLNRGSVRPFKSDSVPRPRSVEGFVLPVGPLDIEIGCGVGMHPLRYAQTFGDRTIVAIEHTRMRFSTFERALKQQRPPLSNLQAIHANAIGWITHALPRECVDRYFLLYPNPFPKSTDLNKRWYAMPFMERILETLRPGGTLTLATNMDYYALEAREYFTRVWGLRVLREEQFKGENAMGANTGEHDISVPRTHFEKKYLERGETCFNLVVQKS